MSVETNEISSDDLRPIIDYYRKRASDLEYEFLQFQVAASKQIEQLRQELAVKTAEAESKTTPKSSTKAS